MSRITRFSAFAVAAALGMAAAFAPTVPAAAAGETFKVISVDEVGCESGEFKMTVERANLDGDSYTVRTVLTSGASIYMNEDASISINGLSNWTVFDNFSYGPVANQGTYPIPAGQTMRLDFTLERPIGTVLHAWTLVVDGCDTGNIISNGPTTVQQTPPTRPELNAPTTAAPTTAAPTTAAPTTAPPTTAAPTTVAPTTAVPTVPTEATTTTARSGQVGSAPSARPIEARASYTG